ncbi:O-methyltransferase [Spartinivicinus ruber]|uniref:O-methyltransferase n=1 Tax=Spartinivicinus ruber TaxID=2683272 RepID=UPI0013D555E8|nr:class I SAM-dependent methyltransferase [Spartinivicinus ruber]
MDDILKPGINDYCITMTQPGPTLLEEVFQTTKSTIALPQMISSRVSGRLLKILTQISNANRVLEVGMFTGYSALCMAESLPPDGKIVCCEIEQKHIDIASSFFRKSPHGYKIQVLKGPALQTLESLDEQFDLAFIDADKENYPAYYELVLKLTRPGGVILIDDVLRRGRVLDPKGPEEIAIHQLNDFISRDSRVENVLISVRDGINLIRKN